jgi:hypothetical protein
MLLSLHQIAAAELHGQRSQNSPDRQLAYARPIERKFIAPFLFADQGLAAPVLYYHSPSIILPGKKNLRD